MKACHRHCAPWSRVVFAVAALADSQKPDLAVAAAWLPAASLTGSLMSTWKRSCGLAHIDLGLSWAEAGHWADRRHFLAR